ncbi:hypothetical protein V5N11_031363 [Cardamine amara subsp. amara]|uniref:Uncharacterized protein n=1 Tax=Cardamine amara subsp. amara TaxID=228776 RepID=A0ABD1AHJ6_CARAN
MHGQQPKYLHMYIVDADNEVPNRVKMMSRKTGSELDEDAVAALINMLDEHNSLCKFFRKARDRFKDENIKELTIRFLDSIDKGKQYALPTFKKVVGLIVGDLTAQNYERDIVVQLQSDQLQRIRDDHPLLMSLQYPLLFPYGEYGFHTEITHAVT